MEDIDNLVFDLSHKIMEHYYEKFKIEISVKEGIDNEFLILPSIDCKLLYLDIMINSVLNECNNFEKDKKKMFKYPSPNSCIPVAWKIKGIKPKYRIKDIDLFTVELLEKAQQAKIELYLLELSFMTTKELEQRIKVYESKGLGNSPNCYRLKVYLNKLKEGKK